MSSEGPTRPGNRANEGLEELRRRWFMVKMMDVIYAYVHIYICLFTCILCIYIYISVTI